MRACTFLCGSPERHRSGKLDFETVTVPHTPKESENKIPGQTPRGRLDLGTWPRQSLDPQSSEAGFQR
ncbi:uncharacterized protein Dsimw501_GD27680 [Drosophila simulans]|nr:uncharacterized protein Dsimw501_GD27680 [Drosophila simulans]